MSCTDGLRLLAKTAIFQIPGGRSDVILVVMVVELHLLSPHPYCVDNKISHTEHDFTCCYETTVFRKSRLCLTLVHTAMS